MRGDFVHDSLLPLSTATARKHVDGPFWSHDEPSIIERDGMRIVERGGMFEPQLEWWYLPNFIKVLVGGYGAGKTISAAKRAIASALINAPVPVATVSPTFTMARDTIITTIEELLDGKRNLLGPGFRWTYNKSTHKFTIKYKGRRARITCYSGDNPLSLRGPNLGAAYIDEPFIQDYAVFKQMLARVRHPDAKMLEIALTGTPEQMNWGYDLCVGEERGKHDVGYVVAPTASNLVLSRAYVERLLNSYSAKEAEAYVGGKFVNLTTGAVYHAFDSFANTVKGGELPSALASAPVDRVTLRALKGQEERVVKVPKAAELGCGMDFNVDPMSATVFYTYGDLIHFIDEIELPNSDTEEMTEVLRERWGDRLQTIYPDPACRQRRSNAPGGITDKKLLERAGYKIEAPTKSYPRRDSFNACNAKFKARDGSITATVDRGCVKLIKYLGTYSYELMNKQKQMSHLLDAFRYPTTRLFPIDRETVKQGRLSS